MERLTNRELEVLYQVVKGYSNTRIAKELIVTTDTVKAHVCSLLSKFNVKSRVALAVMAVGYNIVDFKTINFELRDDY